MIQIKPNIEQKSICPYCSIELAAERIIWQGIHVCAEYVCSRCNSRIIEDLRIGHAIASPYKVNLERNKLYGDESSRSWFGEPLLESLKKPETKTGIDLVVEQFYRSKKVIILNCIDFLFGHTLLKLLNAEIHIKNDREFGLVVLVPAFLRWVVPAGVAEVWIVDISLSKARSYYPSLDRKIKQECERFDLIYLSPAYSHPKYFDITNFTRVERHNFSNPDFRITFIWREDRLWWWHDFSARAAHKMKYKWLLLRWQNFKIRRLFSRLQVQIPYAKFTVAGLGVATRFPSWVDDKRVARFTDDSEREACVIYSESRLIIGVHGSNMLLPSAHAGVTINLMPRNRWGNFAQDILYQESDSRMSAFKYRYLPQATSIGSLTTIALLCITGYKEYKRQMLVDL